MKHPKVVVGLSGGVDSAVAAALLKQQGYDVTGVFLICYNGPGCRTDEDRKDALDVALKLNIPFEVLDFRKEYQSKVLAYFKQEYQAGRTPNPDVACNREIKFGLFYQWALRQGFDYVATGHYARIINNQLVIPRDRHKDQTYFLYQLREDQLKHILFPIGGMTKPEVRQKAQEHKLLVAQKPDSQGICFVGEVSALKFLKKMGVKERTGKVVDVQGNVIGTHRGIQFYTIGQRHGFEVVNKRPDSQSLFVINKDIKNNVLVVGTREECLKTSFEVEDLHWINERADRTDLEIRIRHGGELIKAKLEGLRIFLEKPVFGVAPGQACVFYQENNCLGGGVIK